MIKKVFILIILSFFSIFLYLSSNILEEKNRDYDKKIAKYNLLINKLRNVKNINEKLFKIVNDEKIKIYKKDEAENRVVNIFDKYSSVFSFKIKSYESSKDKISIDVSIDKILKNRKDSNILAKMYEENRLEDAILIYKNFEYKDGEVKGIVKMVIPFRELL